MSMSNIFCDLVQRNKRVRVEADNLKTSIVNFFYTLDSINKLGRFDSVLSNSYSVDEYRCHKVITGLLFPSAVTVGVGNQYEDFLDRSYRLCEDYADARLLTPKEFVDEFICICALMKVTLNESDFEAIVRKEQVVQDGSYYQYGGLSSISGVMSVYPIPVTMRFKRARFELTSIDDEYVREFLTDNVFNTLLRRSS